MKIEVTEEMREAVRLYRRRHEAFVKRGVSDDRLGVAEARLARLVAEAVEREKIAALAVAPGPCFEDTCTSGSAPGSAFCEQHDHAQREVGA